VTKVERILVSTVSWTAAVALAVGGVAGAGAVMGRLRHEQDAAWCRKVTPTEIMVKGVEEPVDGQALQGARAGCEAQRRSQRGTLGAVWKTGGLEMATCAVDWGRFQQLSDTDPAAAGSVTAAYGISGGLDAASRDDQHRFIAACLATHRH
jgi:hypothetical protein